MATPQSTVGIFAPGSPVDPARLAKGLEELKARGYSVKMPFDPSAQYGQYEFGFACESVEKRLSTLVSLLKDSEVSFLLGARGAYGTMDLLSHLPFNELENVTKPLIGYSDITALLVPLHAKTKIPCIHGPTLSKEFSEATDNELAKESVEMLLTLLSGKPLFVEQWCREIHPGTAKGKVLAGNLSVLVSLLGSPYDIDYQGRILFIEDLGESPYRVHRMLRQLSLAGKFNKLAGLVIGSFSRVPHTHGPSLDDVFSSYAKETNTFPIVTGFPFGHEGLNVPLLLGSNAEIIEGRVVLEQKI